MKTTNLAGANVRSLGNGIGSIASAILAFTLGIVGAWAQVPTGAISGTVKDSSGAVVAGANVTATSKETGLTRTAQSGADGHFKLNAVPVGVYDVKTDMEGFQSQVQQNLNLSVGQEAVLGIALNVGAVTESVSVTAAAPLVETTSGSLGGLVNEQKVVDLPLNGRNFNSLVLLEPGITVHKPISATSSTSIGLAFSSNGAPIRSNYMTLDGASLNSANGITGVSLSGSMLGVDGVREFRIITNSPQAEYGMTMGSQMIIASKGGTNQLHGTVFEFLRNEKLDANDFFLNNSNQPKAPFKHNNYGGSVGGPIKKDKTFFFAAFEGVREVKGKALSLTTLTQRARTNGGLVPTVNPLIVPYLQLYPLPNGATNEAAGTGTFAWAFSQPTDEDYGQVRVDHNFSDSDQLFVRYTIDDTRIISPVLFPGFEWDKNSRGQFLTLAENHTFSPVVLNSARLSYSRPFQGFQSPSSIPLSFLQGGQYGMGTLAVTGLSSVGPTLTNPNFFNSNEGTASDDVSLVKEKHSFKFGILFNRYRDYILTDNFRRGNLNFAATGSTSAIQNFLLGVPNQMQVTFANSISDRTFVWNTIGLYGQDDWRITPRLTLNLGLRYEIQTETHEVTGTGSAVRDTYHDTKATLGPALYQNPSLKNFSPRFGFAWDVQGNGKTAVRGGFGIFYDIAQLVASADIETTATPPFSGTLILNSSNGLLFPNKTPIPAPGSGPIALRTVMYKQSQPHLLSYNMSVQRQLTSDMALTVAYAGSKGISLTGTIEGDPTIPTILPDGREFWSATAPRVNPAFNSCECKTNGLDSWYNSLQVSLRKNLTHSWQAQASYTFAKTLDDTQGQHGGEAGGSNVTGTDPTHLGTDKGPADFNVPQAFVFNTLYALPSPNAGVAKWLAGGWRMGTIFTAQNGLPFTAYLSGNHSRSGVLGSATQPDRPDLVPGCKLITGKVEQYFDPGCFTVPVLGFLGTEGRNIMRGPNMVNWDFSLTKDTPVKYLGEAGKLEFRAEFFNVLNHTNFAIPNAGAVNGGVVFSATPTSTASGKVAPQATAGQLGKTSVEPREIQFALKVIF